MTELVAHTLQRIFHRAEPRGARPVDTGIAVDDERPRRPDFAETRPVVFRSEAFAEDLCAGAA
ncbi:MAG: hypothetical protein KF891_15570 [Rhizobacter sp.]|nr:hypothetical protein [Rhizobacter sp.]